MKAISLYLVEREEAEKDEELAFKWTTRAKFEALEAKVNELVKAVTVMEEAAKKD